MKNLTRLFIMPLAVLTGGLALMESPARSASFNCTSYTNDRRAYVTCVNIQGGEVRARADCRASFDRYSGWFSKPGVARTGKCSRFGIRKAIIEFREK